MEATAFYIIPKNELEDLKSELFEIKSIMQKKPSESFTASWIPSSKVPDLLDISPRTWQEWRDKRIIPFSQFGNKIFVKLSDLNALLESKKIEAVTR